MIILDQPYVSPELLAYAAARQEPVLDNYMARACSTDLKTQGRQVLNLVPEDRFAAMLRGGQGLNQGLNQGKEQSQEQGQNNSPAHGAAAPARLYTCSENSLAWVTEHCSPALAEAIAKLKNKALTRELLRPLDPDYYYRRLNLAEMQALPFEALRTPCVLKPAVGFFSLGVYRIGNAEDWHAAKSAIAAEAERWAVQYPQSVVDGNDWLLEEYIDGDEYAVDVYFDQDGQAVICNILRHEFTGDDDVSDRLYYTSADIIHERLAEFEDWFNRVNAALGLRNFPAHVELRRHASGRILPIEFNPLRFAGWCSTDVSLFAWGFHSYGCFLEGVKPDWNSILKGKKGKLYTLMALNKPANCPPIRDFDYEALAKQFAKVLCLRRNDYTRYGLFGFLFTETPENQREELDRIARSDLLEFALI
ncbi:ATP-grasp domain-containing protein [Desulfovibrio sp.]|uniref:ATP-grasp domain-containing protein n=1 Tax=Desulfovibrio sp. TaxID=885 RepID=UPI003D0E674B